ncbi:MAG: MBOAT family protein [Chitinispirillaceae bacterium]|nr:MBOAT family protein [Chitinispirillaceae bacterium]
MVFSSFIFLFYFLPAVLIGYYLIPYGRNNRLYFRNLFLTIASYIFYGWHEPWFVILMWVSTAVDFIAGKLITSKGASQNQKNFALIMSCIVNLSMLGFFKYYMFATQTVNSLLSLVGIRDSFIPILKVTLPIGISFYTFQTMSYTIDLWRGNVKPAKNFSSFACFVSLFPQLIAGPIVRYSHIMDQLNEREHTFRKFSDGVAIFILGFAKKVLLANEVGKIADAVFGADSPTVAAAWWGALAYHFQIYFDFSGYSDMAIGLGRMFGFEFLKNFNAPYRAINISDFWKRWHISLSSWIRDYLYIPLGGNRYGQKRTYLNLIISFFLCGLWHGANFTFIVWGIFHSVFLIIERIRGKRSLYERLPIFCQIFITNIIVVLSWIFFRAPDLSQAGLYYLSLCGIRKANNASLLLEAEVFRPHFVCAMVICTILICQPIQAFDLIKKEIPFYGYIILFLIFIVAILSMFNQSFNPFLYFQF